MVGGGQANAYRSLNQSGPHLSCEFASSSECARGQMDSFLIFHGPISIKSRWNFVEPTV